MADATPHTPRNLPAPPPRRRALVRQQILYGGLAVFGLGVAVVGLPIGLALAIVGGTFAYLMARWGRRIEAVEVYHLATRGLHLGDPAAATRVLDDAAHAGVPLSTIPQAVAVVRTEAALQEGHVAEARRLAAQGLAAPVDRLDPVFDRVMSRELRGLAAIAHATAGHDDEARGAIAAIELDVASPPRALARASLAASILLAREGKKAELAERIARGRRILDVGASTHERALARAFDRLARTPSPSVCRRADVARDEAGGDWIRAAAGEAAPFLPPAASGGAVLDPKRESPQSPPLRSHPFRRLVATGGLAGLVYFTFHTLDRLDVPRPNGASTVEVAALAGAVLLAVMATRVRRATTSADGLVVALGAWARGDVATARRAWMALRGDKHAHVAAGAALALAADALRDGDCEAAREHARYGLERLEGAASAAPTAAMLRPELQAMWAYATAPTSPRAARAAAADLPDYGLAARARFRVELAARIAEGDLDGAADWAERGPRDASLDGFDEVLADAVRLAARGDLLPAAERARIGESLAAEDKRRFVDGIAPGLAPRALAMLALDRDTGPVEPASDDDARALAEAMGADEAGASSAVRYFTGRAS